MALKDLAEVLDPEPLALPIKGKQYSVPPPDGETGVRLQAFAAQAAKAAQAVESGGSSDVEALGDASEAEIIRGSLGTAYDEMLADKIAFPWLRVAGVTAWLHWTVGPEQAEAYWNAADDPEKLAGNRAARRAARSTRQPDSPSGTTPKPVPPGTTGTRSSGTGH